LVLHALPIYLTDDNIPALLNCDYQNLVPDSPIPNSSFLILNSSFLIPNSTISFIVDAIDTIAPKCALIIEAHRRRIPIISSMGAGAKSDITKVQYARLEDTYHCGLSKAVRTRLRKQSSLITNHYSLLKTPVVFSSEQAYPDAIITVEDERNKKSTTGTVSYMPAVFGCYLANYVIRHLTTP